ncbi:HDOD domain-containing protein [Thalassotalea profundi]|uniref:HDOD domain-containing protein n=1 Tax=Thalassotalea profundi TaxID=2036687 RepID=A0ABQ3IUR2_9GAMM|nr:HDOD domain-containing protein [Thalassotalea profundi]GHE91744.1 HDOD domain-containing protein [Thalassotalea profundi]
MLEVNDKIIADISKGFSVPAQPALLLELQKLMAQPEPNLNVIADIITKDVAVAATILKTVNSPIYGLARSISDIHKASRYIGLNGIMLLVRNALLKKSFDQNNCSIALEEFWQNATNIANTCVAIGKTIKQAVSADVIYSLGLFHDCGIPVMAMRYSDYSETYEHAYNTPSETLTSIEDSVYQVNHATIGYFVASSWNLPKNICQLILAHHERDYLKVINGSIEQLYFAILKLSENLVHTHKHFRESADWPYLKDSIFILLELDDDKYQDLLEDSAEIQI